MDTIKIGDTLPNLTVHATGDKIFNLTDLKGKNVVLYFYPKDNTPGCTMESKDFRDAAQQFAGLNTVIYGISRDNLNSHARFSEKLCLPFDLISDPDSTLCNLFDVLGPKNMFGKLINMIQRSTFLFDQQGKLRHQWRKVKVNGHVKEIIAAINQL